MSLATWLALATLQVAVAAPDSAHARVEREAWVMGTRVRIAVEDVDRERAVRTGEAALRELERMEALLSTWDPSTPLSRLNAALPGTWVPLAPELATLLTETRAWSGRAAGAFEPALGALVDAWDVRGPGRTPGAAELARALAATGDAGILIERDRLLRKSEAAWVDAGAFGKGAALRSVLRHVLRSDATEASRVLVDLGGQALAWTPVGAPWRIQVAHPSDRAEPVLTLAVPARSVATTGTSERGRHVLDPRTGVPVRSWGSVTVVDRDPLVADILSTALYVMGPEAGLAWAERAGVAAVFLTETAGRPSATWTSELGPWLLEAPGASRQRILD